METKIIFLILVIVYMVLGYIAMKKRYFIFDEVTFVITLFWPFVLMFDKIEKYLPQKFALFIEIIFVLVVMAIIGFVFANFFRF